MFIPEAAGGAEGAANVFYAIGARGGFGFAPFGIDGMAGDTPLAQSYDVLSQLAPLILENQPKGRVMGVVLGQLTPSQKITLGQSPSAQSAGRICALMVESRTGLKSAYFQMAFTINQSEARFPASPNGTRKKFIWSTLKSVDQINPFFS